MRGRIPKTNVLFPSIHFQIENYLNKKKVIYIYQSGFRTNHSTGLCLAQLIDIVAIGMDKQMHTGMILVDLQKAFDTLDHGVLLEKMKYFGFRASVIKWFESYLSNRKFLVCIDVFFCGWNINVRCTRRLHSWTTPYSITGKWYSPIIIRCRLLFICGWHLYLLPTWGR